jgi:hypothetical protein
MKAHKWVVIGWDRHTNEMVTYGLFDNIVWAKVAGSGHLRTELFDAKVRGNKIVVIDAGIKKYEIDVTTKTLTRL